MSDNEECDCGRGSYDPNRHKSCYECYLDRRAEYATCLFCGKWHNPRFATCFNCRQIDGRDEAAAHLRRMVLARDQFTCDSCATTEGSLEVDHIVPCALGGTADPWNLQTLCSDCNRAKGADWDAKGWDAERLCDNMHAYFTYLWEWLSDDERDRLTVWVADWLDYPELMPEGKRHLRPSFKWWRECRPESVWPAWQKYAWPA